MDLQNELEAITNISELYTFRNKIQHQFEQQDKLEITAYSNLVFFNITCENRIRDLENKGIWLDKIIPDQNIQNLEYIIYDGGTEIANIKNKEDVNRFLIALDNWDTSTIALWIDGKAFFILTINQYIKTHVLCK